MEDEFLESVKDWEYKDGLYTGTILKEDKLPEGEGTLIFKNKEKYVGGFIYGKKSGKGKYYFADGRIRYDGSWKGDEKDGLGTYVHSDGEKYMGGFKNGIRHGDVVSIFYKNGKIKFKGAYKNNKRDGAGELYIDDGRLQYKGEFVENVKEGFGEYYHADGRVYKGQFKGNKRNGKGELTISKGVVYKGEFKDDAMEGTGQLTDKDGNVFIGDFKNGKKEGFGVIKNKKGKVKKEGYWAEGVFVGKQKKKGKSKNIKKTDMKDKKKFDTEEGFYQKKYEKLVENMTCVKCKEHKKTAAPLPCRHLCICGKCAKKLKECPVCQKKAQAIIHLLY